LQSERASLLVFDESANELVMKAGVGLAADPKSIANVALGEGVAGEVLQTGQPMVVADIEHAGRRPAPPERRYKTKSFISFPITIAGRKIGVLNVTDKSSGGSFDEVDLSLLEIIGPQVALAMERAEWQERATEFQLMSITDPLTALPNRRYLEERLTEELNRSKRYEYAMSFLMIDIDDFKAYNDHNGHQAGDLALQITAHCLKSALRSADVASRYGGEEFCILLPQTPIAEAGVIANRIRQRVASTHYPHGKAQPLGRVTVSIGVSTFSPVVNSAVTVIAAADRALYQAKSIGKDRVEFYQDDSVKPFGK
ncbi:MAG: GGDEF domain-containing protein, partial [Pyrinomonadaceae bacterium]